MSSLPAVISVGSHVKHFAGWGVVQTIRRLADAKEIDETTSSTTGVSVTLTLSSWRLASNAAVKVTCTPDQVTVIAPPRLSTLTPSQKIERANILREKAKAPLQRGEYGGAYAVYSSALYILNSIETESLHCNSLRCAMLESMVAMLNNSGLCSLKCLDGHDTIVDGSVDRSTTTKGQMEIGNEACKAGGNAVMLIDAVSAKRNGKVRAALLKDYNLDDLKLFGEWKIKALLTLARGLGEGLSNWTDGLATLRTAEAYLNAGVDGEKDKKNRILENWGDEDRAKLEAMFGKKVRKLIKGYKARKDDEKKKEKKRARAMFSGGESPAKKFAKKNGGANGHLNGNGKGKEKENGKDRGNRKENGSRGNSKDVEKSAKTTKAVPTSADKPPSAADSDSEPSSSMMMFGEHSELIALCLGVGAIAAVGYLAFSKFSRKN